MKLPRLLLLGLASALTIAVGSHGSKAYALAQDWGNTAFNCTDFLFDGSGQGPVSPFNSSFQVTLNSRRHSGYKYFPQDQAFNGNRFALLREPSGTLAYLYVNGGVNGVYRCHTQLPPLQL